MARRKKNEATTGNGPPEPDFEAAANIIRSDILGDKEDLSKLQGDLSASWKRVEDGCHVNKKAAKDATKMFNMSTETRDDYLRSLYGMMRAFKIGISADLVDQMGSGEPPSMPVANDSPSDSALLN